METWQDIFAVKIADVHLTETWTLQEDDTLQVYSLKPGWKKFVQRRAFGSPDLTSMLNYSDWCRAVMGRTVGCNTCMREVNPSALVALVPTDCAEATGLAQQVWDELVSSVPCSQCFHEWSLAKVHVLFHMCRCKDWGMVWMRAFRQACRRCPNPRLEEPEFSQETIERVLHNLVLKILQYCYSVLVQPSDLLEVVVDVPVAGPHDSTRCDGCQLGICSESRLAPASDACEPSMDVDQARTHRDHHTHHSHHERPTATPAHHTSLYNSNFPWKCCCCIGSCLLCILAVLLFVLLYFTKE